MPAFHETRLGRTFFEHQIPAMLRHLPSLTQSLEKIAGAVAVPPDQSPEVFGKKLLDARVIIRQALAEAAHDDEVHDDACSCISQGQCWQKLAREWMKTT